MVLQQKAEVALWGWDHPGTTITISGGWLGQAVTTVAGTNGKWFLRVQTAAAGGPYSLKFSGSSDITVNNILLGEVWLASGQSNMEFFLGKTSNPSYNGIINYEETVKDADHPDIRMIDVANRVADSPQYDFKGDWKISSRSTIDTFSAVAYFFARAINRETGFPVGIINSTWGGTPAESWTSKSVLESVPIFQAILKRYQQEVADYPQAHQKYLAALAAWKADTSSLKHGAPRDAIGPKHSKSPYKLYNGMIVPIEPYTLRGVIWYQGESNADRAWQYRKLFPAMINNWRSDWKAPDLPFYFVQISPHRSQNPEIRDAQLYVYRTVPHTGIVVTTDNGDSLNIHPRNKELVGERLARWALHNEYGRKSVVRSGPLYKSMKIEGNKIRIEFDFSEGLRAKGGPLTEFTIAGPDYQFVAAKATIDGNSVLVWNDGISDPVAVRFAWRNVPHPNLFNGAGLPASPFRTDALLLTTQGKN